MKKLIVAVVLGLSLAFSGPALANEATAGAGASADQTQVQGQSQGIIFNIGSGPGGIGIEGGPGADGTPAIGGNARSRSISQGGTGVGFGGNSSVSNSGNSKVMFKNSFNGAKPIRYLPVPSMFPMENYQAKPNVYDLKEHGWNFVSMQQLIAAMNYVDLDADVDHRDLDVNIQPLVKLPKGHPRAGWFSKAPKGGEGSVMFSLAGDGKINGGFKPVAVITIRANDVDDVNSASLAMAAGQWARHMKAERCIFLTEGTEAELWSSGWGIGMSYSRAAVGSDSNDMGQVGAGGFGYSRGKGGVNRMVYLTAIVGNGGDDVEITPVMTIQPVE